MKKLKFLILPIILFTPTLFVLADSFEYTPMEAIPFFGRSSDFCEYIDFVYKFGLSTVSIAALLMVSIGGFMYSTSAGNTDNMRRAKDIITDALIGLFLALAGWLVLFLINPDLTFCKIDKTLKPVVVSEEQMAEGEVAEAAPDEEVAKTEEEIQCEQEARNFLKTLSPAVNINKGYCETNKTSNCTDVCYNGDFALKNKMILLNNICDITMITGATEKTDHSPNSKHYQGKAIDMRTTDTQAECIRDNREALGGTQICSYRSDLSYGCSYNEPTGITHITYP